MAVSQYYFVSLLYQLLNLGGPPTKKAPPPAAAAKGPLFSKYPDSHIKPLCHPRVEEVTKEVDGYFLEHWPFRNEKARKKFVAAGFSRVTCLYFPKALDDRIHFACRLLTVLFLIDGKPISTRLSNFLETDPQS